MFKYDTDTLELFYSKTKYIMAIPRKVTKGGGDRVNMVLNVTFNNILVISLRELKGVIRIENTWAMSS